MLDESGRALVVYHGTRCVFDVFGVFPAFFSNRPEVASLYAGATRSRSRHPNVIPVYLNIENPARIVDDYQHPIWKRINSKRGKKAKAMRWLQLKGYDGVIFTDSRYGPKGTNQYVVFNASQIAAAFDE